jgi:hypothetical protein
MRALLLASMAVQRRTRTNILAFRGAYARAGDHWLLLAVA